MHLPVKEILSLGLKNLAVSWISDPIVLLRGGRISFFTLGKRINSSATETTQEALLWSTAGRQEAASLPSEVSSSLARVPFSGEVGGPQTGRGDWEPAEHQAWQLWSAGRWGGMKRAHSASHGHLLTVLLALPERTEDTRTATLCNRGFLYMGTP